MRTVQAGILRVNRWYFPAFFTIRMAMPGMTAGAQRRSLFPPLKGAGISRISGPGDQRYSHPYPCPDSANRIRVQALRMNLAGNGPFHAGQRG